MQMLEFALKHESVYNYSKLKRVSVFEEFTSEKYACQMETTENSYVHVVPPNKNVPCKQTLQFYHYK